MNQIVDPSQLTDHIQYISGPGPDGDLWGWAGVGWYFWDETQSQAHGPYNNYDAALTALREYAEALGVLRKNDPLYIHLRKKP